MVFNSLLFLIIILIVALPFSEFFKRAFIQVNSVQKRLDTYKQNIGYLYFSKIPLWYSLIFCLDVVKGYAVLFVIEFYFGTGIYFLFFGFITLVLHNWSYWLMFKNRQSVALVSWGMYAYLDPILAIIFPILIVSMSLLFNSFVMGQFVSCLLMFVAVWFITLTDIYLLLNFIIFCVTFFAFSKRLIQHFEGDYQTLLKDFQRRL